MGIGPRPATFPPKEEILRVMVQYMEVGLKRSAMITCSMLEKVLIVMGEVDIGLRPALLPPIIELIWIDLQVL